MAQQVLVQLVDDLDGTSSNDVSTLTFGLDGVTYEIDLGSPNAEKLRKTFEEYVAVARRTGGRLRRGTAPTRGSSDPGEAALVREWALENGFELSGRGRIPGHVIEAYKESKTVKPSKRGNSRKKS
jgi:hypothetical protein